MSVYLIIGCYFLISVVYGFYNSLDIEISLEVNTFKFPYWKFGLFSQRVVLDDHIEDVIIIGMVFISIEVVFYKELEA